METTIQKQDELVKKMEGMETLIGKLNEGSATLHVRVVYDVGLTKVILAQTAGCPSGAKPATPAAPATAAPKK
jgi:hypothetical protein